MNLQFGRCQTYILAVSWSMKEKNRCRAGVDRVEGTIPQVRDWGLGALTENSSLTGLVVASACGVESVAGGRLHSRKPISTILWR